MTGENNEDGIGYVLSDMDYMCVVARSAYGHHGVVLMTPEDGGDKLLPEVAQIPLTTQCERYTGLPEVLH